MRPTEWTPPVCLPSLLLMLAYRLLRLLPSSWTALALREAQQLTRKRPERKGRTPFMFCNDT